MCICTDGTEKVLAIRYGKERAQEEGARLLRTREKQPRGWLPYRVQKSVHKLIGKRQVDVHRETNCRGGTFVEQSVSRERQLCNKQRKLNFFEKERELCNGLCEVIENIWRFVSTQQGSV